jgi:hypothetical protein
MAKLIELLDGSNISTLTSSVNGYVPTWNSASSSWSSAASSSLVNGSPYQISGYAKGSPAANEYLLRFISDRTIFLSTTSTDHLFGCESLPSSTVTMDVYKIDNDFGISTKFTTVTFLNNLVKSSNNLYVGSVGTLSSEYILSPGDYLYIRMGSTANASFSNVVFSLSGTVSTVIYGGAIFVQSLTTTTSTTVDLSTSTFFNAAGTYELIRSATPLSVNLNLINVVHTNFSVSKSINGNSVLVTLS